jgi:hypothetical protein
MGRHMVELAAAGQCAPQRVAITKIAMSLFDVESAKIAEIAVRANQHANLRTRADHCARHGCTDKSCRACDEGFHVMSRDRSL